MEAFPARLGKYYLLEQIAQGGMAEIYRAKTVGIAGFEKILAVKRIRPHLAREPRFIRNFIDEARIAVSLNHRNIVQIFDFGKADGELFLAMELIEGVDLRSAVRMAVAADIALPVSLGCYVLADVGAGLDYAHRKTDASGKPLGIVHCDVSPQNVILSNEGFVKILDFGVARAHFTVAPKTRRLRGKPRYMAPEQTRGETPSPATDTFALGILGWELLTGLPLFDGNNVREILAAVRRADAPRVDSLNPEVPEHLALAIARALHPQPALRGSASDLATAFARAARDLATVASSRALADWLESVIPAEEDDVPTQELDIRRLQDSQIATEAHAAVEPTKTSHAIVEDPDVSDEEPTPTVDTRIDLPAASAVDTLLDKRRVVVTAVLLDGGSEDARRQLSGIVADLAYKREAVVHDRGPDSLIAVFGLEVAGEDNVANAMRLSLDAVELARETASQADRQSSGITIRTATRAGVVALRRDDSYRIRADAVDEARALAREAEPNRPLLSGGASRLASAQFAFRELPAKRYRSRRLRVLELLGPRSQDERVRALRDRSGRFVDREQELASLRQAFEKATAAGESASVAIVGGAGVGKSRLVAEFVAQVASGASAPVLLAVAAGAGHREVPFSTAIELVQASLNLPPERGSSARGVLARRLSEFLSDAGLDSPEVESAVDAVEQAMELRDGALPGSAQPSAHLRDRVAGSVRRLRSAVVSELPRITVIENLHLADPVSSDVFRSLLDSDKTACAELIIVTAHELSEATVRADDVDEVISLAELDSEQRRELIRERLAEAADDSVVEAIARRAGGNPMFIEELSSVVREGAEAETPATVRDVIQSKIDRLPLGTKAVLQHAAVIGPSFRSRILEELVAAPIQEHLQTLAEEGLLVRRDHAEVDAEEGHLTFRHGLIQEVVYESLSAGPRRHTHARLGQLLALRCEAGRDEPPARVARHLALGGQDDKAADYWLKAGNVALAAFEQRAAQDAFSRVLELDRDASARRITALLGRERASRELGDHAAQSRDLTELERLAASDASLMTEVKTRIANSRLRAGDFAGAIAAAQEGAAATDEDSVLRGEALRVLGEAYERTGEYQRGMEATERAIAIFRDAGAVDAEVRARIDVGRNQLMRSLYRDAQATYRPVLEHLKQSPDPWLERIVRNHLAVIHLCLGEFEEAMSAAERSIEICEHFDDRARTGDNLSVCGIILNEVGQYDQAKEFFDRALAILEATGSRWSGADCLVYAGTNASLRGDHERAVTLVTEALRAGRAIGAPYIEVNAQLALAGIYLARDGEDDLERALDAAAAAGEVARESTLGGAQALALARQAEALRRRGASAALDRSREAVQMLSQQAAIEGCEEEILLTHYRILDELHDQEAAEVLSLAREGFERKLAHISRPEWRRSFSDAVAVNASIRRALRTDD